MKLYDIYIDPTDFETGMDAISTTSLASVVVDLQNAVASGTKDGNKDIIN